jgi:Fe2+ transport system protein B
VATRLIWALVALILGLAGWLMLVDEVLGISGYAVVGVGVGIGCAVIGSLAHDALAGPRERL